ncbi:MAG: glycoside hydrolase family 10 protein [Sphingobacterium hotanense]
MKRLSVYFSLFFVFALLLNSCSKSSDGPGGTPDPDPEPPVTTLKFPAKEMRGAWIATVWELDWPGVRGEAAQKQKYIEILDRLKALKFNAVFFQVKGMGDAFYNSPYEPWSAAISGTRNVDPGYDVMNFLIEETHARGMEFHAWMNPYRISTRASASGTYPALHTSVDASWVIDHPTIRIYNPALPEVRQRLNDIVKDFITKYNVDGIHFDDYFYPSGVTHNDDADYQKYGAGYSTVESFRRGNVDKAIEGVFNTIKATKPQMVFSVSPAANKDNNYNGLFADVAKWTSSGWVDILIPQLYQEIGNSFNPFERNLATWSQFRGKAGLVIGHGYYKFGASDGGAAFQNTAELVNQFDLARKNQYVRGSVMYSARDVLANRIGITNKLAELYAKDVLMPFFGREVAAKPATPSNVKLSGNELTWSTTGDVKSAVYYFANLTAEGELLAFTEEKGLSVSKSGYYVITAVNSDHVESKESTPLKK